jgi:ferredoxin-NADP reductase
MSTPTHTVQVLDIIPETPNTQSFRLSNDSFEFKPGQALALLIPGDPKKRYYSLSSSPTEKGSLRITIKADREQQNLYGSLFSLKPGSPVEISGPYGSMTLPDKLQGPYYFLAGGSGVAPFRGMIKYILDTHPATETWLFHSVAAPDDLIFKEEFLAWSQNKGFHYIPTFTRWDSPDQTAETGRIGEALLKRHLPLMDGTFYLCGSKEFSTQMEHVLKNLQVPADHIRREQW